MSFWMYRFPTFLDVALNFSFSTILLHFLLLKFFPEKLNRQLNVEKFKKNLHFDPMIIVSSNLLNVVQAAILDDSLPMTWVEKVDVDLLIVELDYERNAIKFCNPDLKRRKTNNEIRFLPEKLSEPLTVDPSFKF